MTALKDALDALRPAAVEAIEKMMGDPAGDMVLVPREALNWLFGEGPDAQGHWFGDGDNPAMSRGRFWWRSKFRAMLAAAPLPAQALRPGKTVR